MLYCQMMREHNNTMNKNIIIFFPTCHGFLIRPVEEQLKQRLIGERYCISRKKGSHTKEVLAVLCQMFRKKQEVVFPEWARALV